MGSLFVMNEMPNQVVMGGNCKISRRILFIIYILYGMIFFLRSMGFQYSGDVVKIGEVYVKSVFSCCYLDPTKDNDKI